MNTTEVRPGSRTGLTQAFVPVRRLLAGYAVLSAGTVGAIVLLRNHSDLVTTAVWVRASIVLASALVTCALAARASRGSSGAYRRLRIISTVMVVAVAVIIALPGDFPLWIKIEQAVCGLLLLCVAVMLSGRNVRAAFG